MDEISVNLPGKSTAILPGALPVNSGHLTGMDVAAVLKRIDERLEALGLSQDRVSRLAGHPDAIRNMRRGKGANARTLAALAGSLKVTHAWLVGETDDSEGAASSSDLHRLRTKRAGLLRELESVDYAISLLEQSHSAVAPQRRRKTR